MDEEHVGEIKISERSWKKSSIIRILLSVIAVAVLLCLTWPPKEPSYKGKSLSYWLEHNEVAGAVTAATNDPTKLECREAIRHIGTNAIPSLLRMLRAKDSALKMHVIDLIESQDFVNFRFPISTAEREHARAVLGFFCLDDLATSAVPALVDIYSSASSADSKASADSVLKAIYPASGGAIPYWLPEQQRVQWYLEAGEIKLQLGSHSNAVLAFSEAIKLNPTNAPAFLNRGSAKFELKDVEGALRDINRAIQLDSSNEAAFYSKGVCEFVLKDFKSADADLTTAVNFDTNDARAYNARGLTRANLRKLDEALADFNESARLSGEDASFYRSRAIVETLQKEYELALADATKAVELDGKNPTVYVVRGRIKNALKEYASALLDFERAIRT